MNPVTDVTTLTEFAPPPKEKSFLPRWLNPFLKRDDSMENLAPPANTEGGRTPPAGDPRSVTSSPTLIHKIRNFSLKNIEGPEAKKYWMPDDDAAVCYECQQPFSIFVRRHHCRICGLLFCWKCSDHSIEDYQGADSPIRVCNYCYSLLHTPGYNIESPDGSRRDSSQVLVDDAAITVPEPPAPTGLHKLIYSTSFLKGTSPFARKDPPAEEVQQPEPVPLQYDEEDDELGMYDDDDNDSSDDEISEATRGISPKADGLANGSPSADGSFDSFKIISDRTAPSPLPEGYMSPRRKSEDPAGIDEPTTPRLRGSNASPASIQNSAFVHLAEASLQPLAQHPRVTNRDKSWAQFPVLPDSTLGLSTGTNEPQVQAKAHQIIDQSADRHLVRLVAQLLAHGGLSNAWAPTVLKLARQVCKRVQLNVKGGDKMNVRNYVKVKKIPGGTMQDCQYVEGVVITKNVTHKKMRARIESPRILLLSCSLEYQRVENRLLFFDYLITQERPYLKILVSKIAALKPDLVLVEKTVSRHAQDFLLEENISLASNVKSHVMERLSRQLRGELLPTLDILLPLSAPLPPPPASSSSTSFSTIPAVPPAAPPPPAKLVKVSTGEEAVGSCGLFRIERYTGDWGAKTLMHFEDCPKELGCTLTIRGGSAEELARVKTILLFSIYAAYSLYLEGHLLLNEHATFQVPNDKSEKSYDLTPAFSCSSQVEFVEPALPSRLLQPHINTYTYTPTRYASLHPRGKGYLLASFQVPHSHSFFGENAEYPSLLQLQCTLEDDTSPGCSCNHPFSLERPPNADFTFVTPVSSPPTTVSPSLSPPSSTNPASPTSNTSVPTTITPSSVVVPLPLYPNRPSEKSKTHSHAHAHPPHAHGHLDAHVDAHAHDAEPHTAYSMQTMVYVHSLLCSTTATQCIPHELHAIDYYSDNDITLGEFLEQMCFDTTRLCQVKECNRNITQHERSFIHGNGRLNVTVETIQRPVAQASDVVLISSYCKLCKTATPFSPISTEMWNYSFGKFLELSFYCTSAINQSPECAHSLFRDHIRYYSFGTLVAQIAYEPIQRLHVVLPPIRLEYDPNVKIALRQKELGLLTQCSDQVYDAILAKLTQLQTTASSAESGVTELAEQISTFIQSLQKEKTVFMSKLTVARERDIDPNELRDLTRTLYANFMMWNSLLNEVVNNASNADAYKSKLQSRKLNVSTSSTISDTSPRVSRGISKQDLASIAEHASDLSHGPGLVTSPVSDTHANANASTTANASASASAPSSAPESASSSYTNYTSISLASSSASFTSSPSVPSSLPTLLPKHITQPSPSLPVSSQNPSTNNSPRALEPNLTEPAQATLDPELPTATPPPMEVVRSPQVQFAVAETEQDAQAPVQIEVTPPGTQSDFTSPATSPNVGMDSLSSPSGSRPSAQTSKPSKIMTTINTFVSAISSSRILDPTIPYLFLPQGEHNEASVAIYENEPSTIIAYTLSSAEFKEKFNQHYNEFQPPTPSPVTPPPNLAVPPVESRARSRSQSLSTSKLPTTTSRNPSPEPRTSRSRSSSLVASAFTQAVAGASSGSVKATVIAEEPGAESPEITPNLIPRNDLESLSDPGPISRNGLLAENIPTIQEHLSAASSAYNSEGSESSSASGSANSFSNVYENSGITPKGANGNANSRNGSRGTSPVPKSSPNPTPTPGGPDDGFTDRNVTLAKYLLCGDHREIRNKYVHDKQGSSVTIYCTTFFPLQFNAMRELMAGGEEKFIESLSRCKPWDAKGGKSGSAFAKTLDDRYVIKQVSRVEIKGFLEFAPQYFEYLCKAFFHKVPTLMSKIFGVFRVRWKDGGQKDLIVMENLHYNCTMLQVYDLKGSLRGRLIENPTADDVQLDENLLRTNYTSPICITEYSKTILGQAVWNDTAFLASHNVMDYSMLAGIGKNGELVVGIIDYIRKFTLDKQIENLMKVGLGRGKAPTVISPKQYKTRFRDAMWMYFVMVPNKFSRIIHPPLPPPPDRDREKERQR